MDSVLLAQVINPDATISNIRGVLIGLASLVLIFIGVVALFGSARKGNSSGVGRVLMASALALIPIVIGVGLGAVAFGESLLDFFLPGLS